MVSAASAGAVTAKANAAQNPLSIYILPLSKTRGASYHRSVSTLPATLFSAFEQTARAHARKPFLKVYPEQVELAYGEALDRVGAIAARYRARGYSKGHRVALKLPNCPPFLLHFLALNSLGVSVVP